MRRHQNYRKTLQEKFKLLGFQVEAFQDYKLGVAAATNSKVIGVFIDVIPGLPESVSLLSKLRQDLGREALIFTMSNYPSARDLKYDLKQNGATDCFEKPLHADNFVYILKLLDAALKPASTGREKLAA